MELCHLETFLASDLGASRRGGKHKLKTQERNTQKAGAVSNPTAHTLLQYW